MEVILFILFVFALWFPSIYLLRQWKIIKKFIFINIGLAIIYICVIIYAGKLIWGYDEYGISTILRLIFCIILQTIIVFIFALYKRFILDEKST